MATKFQPYAFNGQVDMTAAMGWSYNEITKFLDDLWDHPDKYNVDERSRRDLGTAVTNIKALARRQEAYLPYPMDFEYQGNSIKHETIFDMLGWVFSVTGTTPRDANRFNYYHRLLALYAYFCRSLCARSAEPQTVHITWFTQTAGLSDIGRVVIGANLDKPSASKKEDARGRRADMLINVGLLRRTERNDSLVPTPRGLPPQKFGHCPETLPLLYIQSIKTDVPKLRQAGGLSIRLVELLPNPQQHNRFEYKEMDFLGAIADPCNNCKHLMGNLGLAVGNYDCWGIRDAFGGQVRILAAMRWQRDDVLNLFADISARPNVYNVDTRSQVDLNLVVTKLRSLVTVQRRVFLDDTIDVSYLGTDIKHQSVFDLVGWLFSVVGTVPPGANRPNYYYPLIALYAAFCRLVIPGAKNIPQMVQITWFYHGLSPTRVALGANLDDPGKTIKDDARGKRFTAFVSKRWFQASETDTSYVSAPRGMGQKFGHCAESLPCLYISSIGGTPSAEGLAARPVGMVPRALTEAPSYSEGDVMGAMSDTLLPRMPVDAFADPCANCEILLRKAGLDNTAFRREDPM